LEWLDREWAWWSHETLDGYVAQKLKRPETIVALSGSGLRAGRRSQELGGQFICDRGSSHIRYQDRILHEEYKIWGLKFSGVDPRMIAKEVAEYEQADMVTVPSEFAHRSFLSEGVPAAKIAKIPYGARLERFQKVADPPRDKFRVLWVGSVGIRKGFLYLLDAFQKLRHPAKELMVIGTMDEDMRGLLAGKNCEGVVFKGHVPNPELPKHYSQAHVFVLPSIEDGFGYVMGEAMACGCPVIASTNTGARDLFDDEVEGFIVPIRSAQSLLEKLELLAQDLDLRERLSEASIRRVKRIGGWDSYGDAYAKCLRSIPLIK
jgi:glycosyltransferase involved in cell wall biosynthesis